MRIGVTGEPRQMSDGGNVVFDNGCGNLLDLRQDFAPAGERR